MKKPRNPSLPVPAPKLPRLAGNIARRSVSLITGKTPTIKNPAPKVAKPMAKPMVVRREKPEKKVTESLPVAERKPSIYEQSSDEIVYQLEEIISGFAMEYPDHTNSIMVPRPGENPLIAFVRAMADSMSKKESQLERLNEEALAAVRAEEQFLANMSHEVRTPMNGIFGMVNLLLEMELSEEQRDYIETIHTSSELLLNVLNDVLDLSKLSARKLVLKPRSFQIERMLRDVTAIYRPMAEKKGLQLDASYDEKIPENLWGDDLRLQQVLVNFLSNAIKFTDSGSVHLTVVQESASQDGHTLLFKIKDTGCGIDSEGGKSLFDPFSQIDNEHTYDRSGTGLGLSICKSLAELMHGQVWFESAAGEGSEFFLSVVMHEPTDADLEHEAAAKKAEEKAAAEEEKEKFSAKVLIVEDNPINQKVARLAFERLGCQVAIASHGGEAVEQASCERTNYDLICMDLNMPVMNGIEATQKIRLMPNQNSTAKILAMTGMAMEEDRNRCLEAGMDDFLTKPFNLEDLEHQISTIRKTSPKGVALSS